MRTRKNVEKDENVKALRKKSKASKARVDKE